MSATSRASATQPGFARASLVDSWRIVQQVVLPTFAKGIFLRRPRVTARAEHADWDTGAIQTLATIRQRYGDEPLLLPIPLRPHLLVLSAQDVADVLERTPLPFGTDTLEKRAALSHFEPGNVLISTPGQRRLLRPFHEAALQTERRMHPAAQHFHAIIEREFMPLAGAGRSGDLGWQSFSEAWQRAVRSMIFGEEARQDRALTEEINALRRNANWAFFRLPGRAKRAAFLDHIDRLVHGADERSLAAMTRAFPDIEPSVQIAQWLFAFDAAGIATFRAMALLAAHPTQQDRAFAEAQRSEPGGDLPFLRNCILESLRLWPTTPVILRETKEDTEWKGRSLARGTGIVIFAPFFHRDPERMEKPDQMDPDRWDKLASPLARALVPFSGGTAICPAHHLVPLLGAFAIAQFLRGHVLLPLQPVMHPKTLPGTLNHYEMRLAMETRAGSAASGG